MPVHFLYSLKMATGAPYLFFDPHDNTVLGLYLENGSR